MEIINAWKDPDYKAPPASHTSPTSLQVVGGIAGQKVTQFRGFRPPPKMHGQTWGTLCSSGLFHETAVQGVV